MYEESIQQTSVLCEKCKSASGANELVKDMTQLLDNLLLKWVLVKALSSQSSF